MWFVTYRDGLPARKRSPIQVGYTWIGDRLGVDYGDRSQRANQRRSPKPYRQDRRYH